MSGVKKTQVDFMGDVIKQSHLRGNFMFYLTPRLYTRLICYFS